MYDYFCCFAHLHTKTSIYKRGLIPLKVYASHVCTQTFSGQEENCNALQAALQFTAQRHGCDFCDSLAVLAQLHPHKVTNCTTQRSAELELLL
jgi:hypothetical protein